MQSRAFGIFGASMAMIAVGAGVTMSAELVDYPVFAAQAVRYAVAAAILIGAVLAMRRPLPRPRGHDWLWLTAVSATGLVLFNIAIIRSVEHAEPAAVAILIGTVPLVLLLAESIRLRCRPSPLLVAGATLVVIGAALVQGGGRTTIEGLGWAAVALACEAAFTLLAVPVLGRLGALAYLAIVQTAIAFSLWYSGVGILGPAVAGLFAGLMPITAALTGIIPGLTTLTPAVIGGSIVVGVGIAIGLSAQALSQPSVVEVVDPPPTSVEPTLDQAQG